MSSLNLNRPFFLVLKTWLLRVKLHRNYLKENKNYFKLPGGLSYLGFKLLRVKLQ